MGAHTVARKNFQSILDHVFKDEGGFVNHPKDPGGATNMGITIGTLSDHRGRRVTVQDVKNLTRQEAAAIYEKRYWSPVRGDDLPSGVDYATFDPAVNSGVSRAARWLQQAVKVKADGKIGSATLAAVRAQAPDYTVKRICEIRMGFLRGLKTFSTFGKGWSRRVAGVEAFSLKLVYGSTAPEELRREAQAAGKSASKNSKEAGGAVVAGGGTQVIPDFGLPDWALYVAAALLVVAAVNYFGRSRHDRERETAMLRVAQEA